MRLRILIVDDDRLIRRSLALHLEDAGYEALAAGDAFEALKLLDEQAVHLILLDVAMPGMDGHDALRHIRQKTQAPVIFVTGRRRELDELVGLELGADDYVTKPFDIDILLARIKAVLRRSAALVAPHEEAFVSVGDLRIDVHAHVARQHGRELELTPKEFDLLLYLAQNPGQVVSMQQMLDHVWGEGWIGEEQTVYVHIRWLRTKIEETPASPRRLITVRGVGYKLTPVETTEDAGAA